MKLTLLSFSPADDPYETAHEILILIAQAIFGQNVICWQILIGTLCYVFDSFSHPCILLFVIIFLWAIVEPGAQLLNGDIILVFTGHIGFAITQLTN